MRILVTFALQQEFAPWRRHRRFRPRAVGPVSAYLTRIAGAEICVGLTGMGLDNAIRAARLLMAEEPDACISTGFAGALRPEHPAGRVLVARAVRMAHEKFLLKTHTPLRRLAAICGARVVNLFYSSESPVCTGEQKAALGLLADAVDMESYAILTEAARCRVPAVAIRAVSDPAAVELPIDFVRAVDLQGKLSWPRMFREIARRPASLPALGRLGLESRRAARSLARFLDGYVEALAGQQKELNPAAQVAVG